MASDRTPGMDHDLYDWAPLPDRPALAWPDQARLAVSVVVQLTSVDEEVSPGLRAASPLGGLGPRPHPNVPLLAHRAYGHRVGVFRVLAALREHGIPATVALDVATAEKYPTLVDHVREQGATIVAAGRSAVDLLTEETPEAVERAYIEETLDALERLTGRRPTGWLSPEYSQSTRTGALLAQAGVTYTLDWVNDDQPYRMNASAGELVALPPTYELDDANALLQRKVTISDYGQMLRDTFDVLYREADASGRLYLLNLRPWLIGQPFRIGHLERALQHVRGRGQVWAAGTDDVVDAFLQQA